MIGPGRYRRKDLDFIQARSRETGAAPGAARPDALLPLREDVYRVLAMLGDAPRCRGSIVRRIQEQGWAADVSVALDRLAEEGLAEPVEGPVDEASGEGAFRTTPLGEAVLFVESCRRRRGMA